jgi:hypothetical protein
MDLPARRWPTSLGSGQVHHPFVAHDHRAGHFPLKSSFPLSARSVDILCPLPER